MTGTKKWDTRGCNVLEIDNRPQKGERELICPQEDICTLPGNFCQFPLLPIAAAVPLEKCLRCRKSNFVFIMYRCFHPNCPKMVPINIIKSNKTIKLISQAKAK